MKNREDVLKKLSEKYDLDVLYSIFRFADKNPNRFNWDFDKEEITYEDVIELLIEKEQK